MTIIVTGGAGGLGEACCDTLSGRERILSLDSAPSRHTHEHWICDVRDPMQFAAALESGRPIRGLVTTASVGPGAAFDDALRTDFFAAWANIVAFIAACEPGSAAVVFGSIAAERKLWDPIVTDAFLKADKLEDVSPELLSAARAEFDGYAFSKALTLLAARPLASLGLARGVRVNAVLLGPVDTPRARDLRHRDPHRWTGLEAECPLGLPIPTEEVTSLIDWLLSPRSAHVTGAVYRLDGGWGLKS